MRIRLLLLPVLLLVPAGAFVQSEEAKKPVPAATLYMDASGRLISQLVSQPVDDQEPYADVIEGTPVYGRRRTLGSVRAELVPDAHSGAVDIVVDGTAYSNEVGVRRQRRLRPPPHVRGAAALVRRQGHHQRERPFAHACITLLGVIDLFGDSDTAPAILTRLGFRADRQHLETIVAGKAMAEASAKLESRINPLLEKASKEIGRGIAFVKDLGVELPPPGFVTTNRWLGFRLAVGASDASALPALPENADLAARLHENAVNAAAQTALGGNTFRFSEVLRTVNQLTEPLLRDPRDEAERLKGVKGIETLLKMVKGAAPELTLAMDDPVTLRFTDAGFRVEAHLASVKGAGKVVPNLRIRAAYRIENSPAGVRGVRTGPVSLLIDKKAEPAPEPVRDVLMAIANEVFLERVALADIAFPRELGVTAPLSALRAETTERWILLSWRLGPKKKS
ncbi:MAG: hypothetical protein U0793_16780 [Gemmataceae bacterium]